MTEIVIHRDGKTSKLRDGAKAWTEDDDACLARMIAQGYTARTIASLMGRTRNSVLGRVHRLKLGLRPGGATRAGRKATAAKANRDRMAAEKPKPKPKPKPEPKAEKPKEPAARVDLTTPPPGSAPWSQRTGCQWIYGDAGGDPICCNRATEPQSAYCAEHLQASKSKERAAA